MNHIKTIIQEMIESRLSEESEKARVTNGEALKIGREAKKMAKQTRDRGQKVKDPDVQRLAEKDANYLEDFASYAFKRDLKMMNRLMNGGETDNREDVFKATSKVIGKERAHLLSRGKY